MGSATTMPKEVTWRAFIEDWKVSGLSQREWCRRNNQSIKKFNYWIRKFRREEANRKTQDETGKDNSKHECYEISFPKKAPITKEEAANEHLSPELTIQFRDYRLFINKGISQDTLRTVLEVLAGA